MGRNGAVRNSVLAAGDQSLNLLAVKTIVVQPQDVESQGLIDVDGSAWEREALDATVGRPNCGYEYARTVDLPLPANVEISAINATAYLRCAEDVPQGTEIATLIILDAEARELARLPLRAGEEVADAQLADADIRRRAKHRATPAFRDPDAPDALHSLVSLRLPWPAHARTLRITASAFHGWLTIGRLTVVDRNGKPLPQVAGHTYLSDTHRWREVRRFRTSRFSDRGRDEDEAGEADYIVYENLKAMPRAWVVPSITAMSLDDAEAAVSHGQMPDGRPFDPARTALVSTEDGDGPPRKTFGAEASTVHIEEASNGRFTMSVTSPDGGFLVVSEAYYPGWRATVDGVSTEVYRTNLLLQGVVVPAGTHRVQLEFAPTILYGSGVLSLIGLGGVIWLSKARDLSRLY
jgi:hypothetical protein